MHFCAQRVLLLQFASPSCGTSGIVYLLLGSVRYSGPVFCLARPGICPGRVAGAGGVRGGWAPHTASSMGAASGGAGSFTFRLRGIHFDARRALRPIFVLHVFSYRCRSGDDQEWVDGLVNSIDKPVLGRGFIALECWAVASWGV